MAIKNYNEEVWKKIIGYEGLYEISNFGRVKSVERYTIQKHKLEEKILTGYNNGNGYWYYDLYSKEACGKKGRKKISAHRLVGEHFLENKENYPCINHKDENRLNNYYENLEWCTYEYNVNYGNRSKKQSESRKNKYKGVNCKLSKKVVCLTTQECFENTREACEYFGIPKSRSHINCMCKGTKKFNYIGKHPKTKQHLTWMYYNDYINKYDSIKLKFINIKEVNDEQS